MTIGIYSIWWEQEDDKVYIGQSVNIEKRWVYHLWLLANNRHSNNKLQNQYNKLGKPKFSIIETCSIAALLEREIYWTDEFNAVYMGYGIMHPDKSKLGYLGANSKYSKLSLLLLYRMLRNPRLSYSDISDITGIHKSTVIQVSRGDKHTWLREKYPSLALKVEAARKLRLSEKYTRTEVLYYVKDKENTVYSFSNISKFCREHNLNIGNFSNMLNGKGSSCGGFSLLETAT